jgi:hypothetical protein
MSLENWIQKHEAEKVSEAKEKERQAQILRDSGLPNRLQ